MNLQNVTLYYKIYLLQKSLIISNISSKSSSVSFKYGRAGISTDLFLPACPPSW